MSDLKFNKREIFPNPSDTFFFKLEPLESIKDDCIFVLDANVLLLPFNTGASSLNAIKVIYQKLVEEDRIFLPAQAAREFLDNRAKKIADLHETLSKKMNQSYQYIGNHPLLGELDEYKALEEQESNVRAAIKSYQEEIKKTLKVIQSWGWNDPVSDMYHDVLGGRVLSDESLDVELIDKDLKRRNDLKIPPGYKDQGKNENQAGDLLIWHEILDLAQKEKKHLAFVSGDGKADWWHQSGKAPLYPRFELVDEYREHSEGKSFHIVNLSSLLTLFNAKEEVVEAVKSSESNTQVKTRQSLYENSDLAEKALVIVRELRSGLAEVDRVNDQMMHEMEGAPPEAEHDIWLSYKSSGRDQTPELMHRYNSSFKIDAIILRDEIISRLPVEALAERDNFIDLEMYTRPTNPIGLRRVIDDLEYLAKCLVLT